MKDKDNKNKFGVVRFIIAAVYFLLLGTAILVRAGILCENAMLVTSVLVVTGLAITLLVDDIMGLRGKSFLD